MIEDTSRPGARTWAEDANAWRWSLFGGFALFSAGFALNRMELGGRGRGVFDHDAQLKAARARAEAGPAGTRWSDVFGGYSVSTLGDAELWQITSVGAAQ